MENVSLYFNGQIKITVVPHEMRMSHWVDAPRIEDGNTGHVLLDLTGGLWSLLGVIEKPDELVLTLRQYPGLLSAVDISVREGGRLFYMGGEALDAAGLRQKLMTY